VAQKRQLQNGDTTWVVRWRDESGKQHSKSHRSWADAKRHEAGVRLDRKAPEAPLRVDDWIDAWLDRQQSSTRHGTHRQQLSTVDKWIRPTFGGHQVRNVKRADVQAWVTKELVPNLAPSTVRTVVSNLAAIMNAAVDDELIAASPVVRLALPIVERKDLDIPPPAQLDAVRVELPENLRAVFDVMRWAGLRLGEATGLTVDVIDFDRLELDIRRQLLSDPTRIGPVKSRTVTRRRVPITETLAATLSDHLDQFRTCRLDGVDLVFTTTRSCSPLTGVSWGRAWRPARDAAGLPDDFTAHDLRHCWTARTVAAGLPVPIVARFLGHSDGGSLVAKRYSHLMPDSTDQLREMLEEFEAGTV